MRFLIIPIGLALFAAPAHAQSIPKLDYGKTCAQTPAVAMDKKSTNESCRKDEEEARRQLPPVWAKASAKARSDCLAETTQGGLPSYVELISCLEGAAAVKAK